VYNQHINDENGKLTTLYDNELHFLQSDTDTSSNDDEISYKCNMLKTRKLQHLEQLQEHPNNTERAAEFLLELPMELMANIFSYLLIENNVYLTKQSFIGYRTGDPKRRLFLVFPYSKYESHDSTVDDHQLSTMVFLTHIHIPIALHTTLKYFNAIMGTPVTRYIRSLHLSLQVNSSMLRSVVLSLPPNLKLLILEGTHFDLKYMRRLEGKFKCLDTLGCANVPDSLPTSVSHLYLSTSNEINLGGIIMFPQVTQLTLYVHEHYATLCELPQLEVLNLHYCLYETNASLLLNGIVQSQQLKKLYLKGPLQMETVMTLKFPNVTALILALDDSNDDKFVHHRTLM
jgi:hypothetical protein